MTDMRDQEHHETKETRTQRFLRESTTENFYFSLSPQPSPIYPDHETNYRENNTLPPSVKSINVILLCSLFEVLSAKYCMRKK